MIDCHDRAIVGSEFSLRGRAKEAERAIERFFRTLKEECVWLHNFTDFTHARREVIAWIHRYNTRRPHSALGYKSPAEYRAQQGLKVA